MIQEPTNETRASADEVGGAAGPQAAAKEALGVEIDGKEPPRGEGAAPGSPPPPDPGMDLEEWRAILKTGIGAGFTLASMRWRAMSATPEEVDALAQAWAPVAQKYAGGAVPIEALAAFATIVVLGPKIAAARAEDAERKRNASAKPKADPGTTVV